MKIRLRHSHPNLWRQLMGYALLNVALALNFILLTPAFDPLGISKYWFGAIFMAMGVAKLYALNGVLRRRLLRFTIAANVGLLVFFGILLIAGFFSEHQTSLQLPIMYFGAAVIEFPMLKEPLVNPQTETVTNGNR